MGKYFYRKKKKVYIQQNELQEVQSIRFDPLHTQKTELRNRSLHLSHENYSDEYTHH